LSRVLIVEVLKPPLALSAAAVKELARQPGTAIVVLGGGRQRSAPEYGFTTLHARSVERLRYGIWLSRKTGLPLAFSGGNGRAEPVGPTEAELAAGIAELEFKHPLRWLEDQSRDTHENAVRCLALLKPEGIKRIVLVTHAYHMPRALRHFQRAAAVQGQGQANKLEIVPATVGRPLPGPWVLANWLPSLRGLEENQLALHELLGLWAGA
jgi:uncharacterized SAM-binding protein YcdF (DUF218 family)